VEKGGSIAQEIYPPLGAPDFAPYLAGIKAHDADVVYAFFAGSDAIRFVAQYTEYGLKAKLPLIGASTLVDDFILPSQGDAAIGVVVGDVYNPLIDTPENQKFVQTYRAKYGVLPSEYSVSGYYSALVIAEALRLTKGNTLPAEIIGAVRRLDIKAPARRLRFDELGQTSFNMIPSKVERQKEGLLRRVPIEVIPEIWQKIVFSPGRP
jgi:branched-chain amino acid transport system substrate-binding protein